jgi:hypothetical protein
MEKLNEILEKYFRAETSVSEENELKKYFSSDDVAPEYEAYRGMFAAFEQEKLETLHPSKKSFESGQRSVKRFWIKAFSLSGIAAALLLALWIQRPVPSDNYAVVMGAKIEDAEFAEQYAVRKLNRANEMMTNGLRSMDSFDKVRQTMKPLEKVSETRDKLTEIQDKLQYK